MALTSEGTANRLGGRGLCVTERSRSEASGDEMLVDAARLGDRAAFGRLYDRYVRLVHGVLLAQVPRDEGDDLVQDVFMTTLRRLSTFRETGSFGAWLVLPAIAPMTTTGVRCQKTH
jgi:Sigma-70 region 2